MKTDRDLQQHLRRIDGNSYRAYKAIAGEYAGEGFLLGIDYVQGDPFASPSRIRIRIPASEHDLPAELYSSPVRRIALEDFLARSVRSLIAEGGEGRRGSGKSGLISIDAGGQEVLERTAVKMTSEWVEARLQVGLPAGGRRILGRQAAEMLCEEIPDIGFGSLCWNELEKEFTEQFIRCVENQESIRSQLKERGLVAFVADGSILPRESGASDRPMEDAIPFRSPDSMRVEFKVPNPLPNGETALSGMGVEKGVTLIVGGGYHGKSTLLQALQRGVYPHILGDGREYVITDRDATKIRSEDGRRVEGVDISPFITHLPHGQDTKRFSSEDASGSTSQAANIIEAVEAGASVLLVDEDTSATNFMVRDARMQALVHKDIEPITPFIDRIREFYELSGVSTVLVMGGCGDYLDVADTVILMREFLPLEVSQEASRIAEELRTERSVEVAQRMELDGERVPDLRSISAARGKREVKIDVRDTHQIAFGSERVDLGGVEQLIDPSQARAVGFSLQILKDIGDGQPVSLRTLLKDLQDSLDQQGLELLGRNRARHHHPGNFARPRMIEVAAALNRLRTLRIK